MRWHDAYIWVRHIGRGYLALPNILFDLQEVALSLHKIGEQDIARSLHMRHCALPVMWYKYLKHPLLKRIHIVGKETPLACPASCLDGEGEWVGQEAFVIGEVVAQGPVFTLFGQGLQTVGVLHQIEDKVGTGHPVVGSALSNARIDILLHLRLVCVGLEVAFVFYDTGDGCGGVSRAMGYCFLDRLVGGDERDCVPCTSVHHLHTIAAQLVLLHAAHKGVGQRVQILVTHVCQFVHVSRQVVKHCKLTHAGNSGGLTLNKLPIGMAPHGCGGTQQLRLAHAGLSRPHGEGSRGSHTRAVLHQRRGKGHADSELCCLLVQCLVHLGHGFPPVHCSPCLERLSQLVRHTCVLNGRDTSISDKTLATSEASRLPCRGIGVLPTESVKGIDLNQLLVVQHG